jgi:hypothetical protein
MRACISDRLTTTDGCPGFRICKAKPIFLGIDDARQAGDKPAD